MFQLKAHKQRRIADQIADAPEDARTLIGLDVHIMGSLRGEAIVEIRGTIEGPCEVKGSLVIRDGGKVVGDVLAGNVVVAGELEGDIVAEGRVELDATGKLTGDIRARQLTIVEGAYLKGTVHVGEPSANGEDRSNTQVAEPPMDEPVQPVQQTTK